MDILLEVRHRLKIAQLSVTTVDGGHFAHPVKVLVEGHRLEIGGRCYEGPASLTLKRRELELPSSREGGFTVRLELGGGMGDERAGYLDLLPKPNMFSGTKKAVAPDVIIGSSYCIHCSSCSTQIGRLKVERVLPLPSSSWRSQTKDWFCCVNKLDAPPPVHIRLTDILYGGAGICVLHSEVFVPGCFDASYPDLCCCASCGAELGVQAWTYRAFHK